MPHSKRREATKIKSSSRGLLAIPGLGRRGTLDIHFGKYAVESLNLGDYFLVFRALKLQRQLVHTPLDLSARELLRE